MQANLHKILFLADKQQKANQSSKNYTFPKVQPQMFPSPPIFVSPARGFRVCGQRRFNRAFARFVTAAVLVVAAKPHRTTEQPITKRELENRESQIVATNIELESYVKISPPQGSVPSESVPAESTFYTSPMRTFVNMQNRFGDFRSNPDCLM